MTLITCCLLTGLLHAQVKDATLKKVKALEEQKEAVETERDTLKVCDGLECTQQLQQAWNSMWLSSQPGRCCLGSNKAAAVTSAKLMRHHSVSA